MASETEAWVLWAEEALQAAEVFPQRKDHWRPVGSQLPVQKTLVEALEWEERWELAVEALRVQRGLGRRLPVLLP